MSKVIGIDLGTTNSVVSIIENDQPKILTNAEGSYTTPSVVAFTKTGEILVGQLAKRQAVSNPENTIYSSKRFIGRSFEEMQKTTQTFPFKIEKKSGEESCVFKVKDQVMTPEKISSLILKKLKKDAETYIGQEVKEAVITVPAYFNDTQRQATKDAGRIAGLDVKRIINEPTAAALAYGMNKKASSKIAVYDFGGGTFDISILEIADKVVEVKATNGDNQLGGDDFDEAILKYLAEEFKKLEGVDLLQDKMAVQRLKEAAEKAKIELSTAQETSINLPFITAGESGAKHLDIKLTRSKFNQLTEELVQKSRKPCETVLQDASLTAQDIDEVILVGGSTRIPAVHDFVKKFFSKEPNQSVNPDQVVAAGAAIQAGILSNTINDVLLLDVTPLSLGIETLGGVMTTLIPKNTTIPTKKSEVFSTAEDNQTKVGIRVLQGERKMAQDNKSLGDFELTEIPPMPRGTPQIEVSFDIDANGIVCVSAKDKKTGKSKEIKIQRANLKEAEINEMVKEAELYEEKDKKRQELALLKNESDHICYESEKLMKENKDKAEASLVEKLQASVKKVRDLLANISESNMDGLKEAKDQLRTELQNFGTHIYQKSQKQQEPGKDKDAGKSNAPKDDEPIDVNYNKKDD